MNRQTKLTFAVLFSLLSFTQCANILGVFPMPGSSHYILAYKLMKGLVEAGHNVTMIAPFKADSPPKGGIYNEVFLDGVAESFAETRKRADLFSVDLHGVLLKMTVLAFMLVPNTNQTLHHPKVKDLLASDSHFDAVILEQFNNDGLKVFSHIYGCPLILLHSMAPNGRINPTVGNTNSLSYIRNLYLRGSNSEPMTFSERVYNVLYQMAESIVTNCFSHPRHTSIIQSAFPSAPRIKDLDTKVSLVLLNSHTSIHAPQPLVPNMVEIGGYHVDPPKKLPDDLQQFMDGAKDGVVYFSMGSNLKSKDISEEKKKMLLGALGKLKQKVIWKFEEDLPRKPDNMLVKKWLPQQDILAHPNVKLFITHGGILSITETIYHGVPILVIPVFGDQPANAEQVQKDGYGLKVGYNTEEFTEDRLSSLIQELLTNSTYRDNARRRSELFHDRPMKPIDSAVYWIGYVIRNNGAHHLRVGGVNQPWYQYYLIDVAVFLFVVTLVVINILVFVVVKLLCYFKRKIWGSNKVKTN